MNPVAGKNGSDNLSCHNNPAKSFSQRLGVPCKIPGRSTRQEMWANQHNFTTGVLKRARWWNAEASRDLPTGDRGDQVQELATSCGINWHHEVLPEGLEPSTY